MKDINDNSFFNKLLIESFKCHSEGNILQAEKIYQFLLDQGFKHPGVFSNYGVICKNKGDTNKAIKLYKKSIEVYPTSPDAYSNLGNIMREQGKLKEAEFYLRKAIKLNPSFYYAYSNLVDILIDNSNIKDAEYYIYKAIKLNPKFANAHLNLGRLLWKQGKVKEAEKATLEAIKLNPNLADAYMNIGGIFIDQGRLPEAEESTLKAIKLNPTNSIAHYNLGLILKNQGRIEESEKSTLKSIELNPNLSDSYFSLGSILIDLGRFKEAQNNLIKAIQINPDFSKAFYLLSTFDKLSDQLKLHQYLFSDKILLNKDNKELIDIYFARANISHQENRYRKSAQFLIKANNLKLNLFPSDARLLIHETLQTSRQFRNFNSKIKKNINQTKHIFIVGMPRSGSTLIESIISINSKVYALGEVNFLEEAFLEVSNPCVTNNSNNLYQLYLEKIFNVNSQAQLTTDKMLYNYQYIDLIVNYIPGAKIIHACRNPLDNILSIYRAHFAIGNTYSSSLIDCVDVYLNQEMIISKFKKKYSSLVYELNYDYLVENPFKHIYSLITWLGWNWDDSYLYPEKNTRSILTRSNFEARNPINTKSVSVWKNYRNMLEPVIDRLNCLDKYSLSDDLDNSNCR